MKRKIKLFFLIIPVIGLITYFIYGNIHKSILTKYFFELKALKWTINNDKLVINSRQTRKGELLIHSIIITRKDGTILFDSLFEIDRDMFGGGFIKAMQVDEDPEMEIVFWRSYGEKFYLDLSKTGINKISFEKTNEKSKILAEKWYRYNVIHQAEISIFIILSIIYYLFAVILYLIAKLFNFFRKK